MSDPELAPAYTFSITLMGPVAAGKTALLSRYTTGAFPERSQQSTSIDLAVHEMVYQGTCVKLHILDQAGLEQLRLRSIGLTHRVNAVIVTFDVVDRDSLTGTRVWLEDLLLDDLLYRPLFLVGCKSDALPLRVISQELAQSFAFEYGASYFETSALTGQGVEELFCAVVRTILSRKQASSPPPQSEVRQPSWMPEACYSQ